MVLNLILFMGSVREGRLCSRVTAFIKQHLETRGHNIILYDPLEKEFPLVKKPLHFHRPDEVPPEWLVQYNNQIREADGYIVVSAEYNRCIPPALTNMLDHFPPTSYKYKPCSIVCYSAGSGGGAVAGMQLRYFLGELGMVTPGFMFLNPAAHTIYDADGKIKPTDTETLQKVNRLLNELEWYASALKVKRSEGLPT